MLNARTLLLAVYIGACLPCSSAFSFAPAFTRTRAFTSPKTDSAQRKLVFSCARLRSAGIRMSSSAPGEDKARMALLDEFRKLSRGEGVLSRVQVNDVLAKLKFSPEDATDMFKQMDLNGDGVISETEFIYACKSSKVCAIDASDEDPMDTELGEVDDKIKAMFARMSAWIDSPPTKNEAKVATGEVIMVKNKEEFDSYLEKAGSTPVCVMFAASYCRKCLAIKPKYVRVAQGYEGKAIFLKCMIEEVGSELVKEVAKVKAVPTFQVWKNQAQVDKYIAGVSVADVVPAVVNMVDRNLEGFSLMDKINGGVPASS